MSAWLVLSENGYYTTPVGSSPENRFYPNINNITTPKELSPDDNYLAISGDPSTAFCEGPTMDIMLIKELFSNCIESANILGIDDEFVNTIKNQKENLQPYQIGSEGQLLEWDKEYKEQDPKHRHISHLYGLCPGIEITQGKTPELFNAAQRSLENRGDDGTGWAMAWKSCCWARLKDGNHAYKILSNLFAPGGYKEPGLIPNMLASCPPFNIDGNFGGGAAIIEMLLQSHETKNVDGEEIPIIDLLPALPDVWDKGEISGLRTANGFEVDIEWNEGSLVQARIISLFGNKVIVRHDGLDTTLDLQKGETFIFKI